MTPRDCSVEEVTSVAAKLFDSLRRGLVCYGVRPSAFEIPELNDELLELEHMLRRSVASEDGYLSEISSHLISAGGKRIRPVLAMASARAVGGNVNESVLLGSVAVELVHLASLHHDDVMDEADTRRGVASVNARWGNLMAVVSGDYLLAKAAGIAARISQGVAEILANTLADMCEGQVIEVEYGYKLDRTPEAYFHAISGKTSSLMAAACQIGAITGGGSAREEKLLSELGHCFGNLFQMRDDIFDLFAPSEVLGKAPGQDIVEGVYNLPLIYALRDPEIGQTLRIAIESLEPLGTINDLIVASGALGLAFGDIGSSLLRLEEIIAEFNSPAIEAVGTMAASMVETTFEVLEEYGVTA